MFSKARNLLPVLVISVVLSTGCNSNKIQSHWPKQPIQVDGQATDWEGLPKYYFEDCGVSLGVSNDADNAYLLFRFSNPKWLMSIAKRGVTVWLDGTAKKKKNFGIRYAGRIPLDSTMASAGAFGTNLSEEQQQRVRAMQAETTDQIIVFDAKEGIEISVPPDGMRGPSACLGSADGVFAYEFAIPLETSNRAQYAIGARPGQKIYVGLEFGAMDKEELQKSREQMKECQARGGGTGRGGGLGPPSGMQPPNGMGPGGGMGRGGGMGPPGGTGRGGGNPEDQMKKMMEGEKIWVKTYLALPPSEKGGNSG
jgi:hypothetical protein